MTADAPTPRYVPIIGRIEGDGDVVLVRPLPSGPRTPCAPAGEPQDADDDGA